MEEYVGKQLLGYSPKGTHKFPVKIAYHVYVYIIYIHLSKIIYKYIYIVLYTYIPKKLSGLPLNFRDMPSASLLFRFPTTFVESMKHHVVQQGHVHKDIADPNFDQVDT